MTLQDLRALDLRHKHSEMTILSIVISMSHLIEWLSMFATPVLLMISIKIYGTEMGISGWQVIMLIVLSLILAVTVTVVSWIIFSDIFVSEFNPVRLSHLKEQVGVNI